MLRAFGRRVLGSTQLRAFSKAPAVYKEGEMVTNVFDHTNSDKVSMILDGKAFEGVLSVPLAGIYRVADKLICIKSISIKKYFILMHNSAGISPNSNPCPFLHFLQL